MRIKSALIRNAVAGSAGQLSNMLYRLAQVPVMLSGLGVKEFGHWIVLTSLPSLLMLASFGFGNVAANDMSMNVAAEDFDKAKTVFSTSLVLTLALTLFITLLFSIVAPFVPWEKIIDEGVERHSELTRTVLIFTVCVLSTFPGDIYVGRFRSARKAHVAMILLGVRSWLELAFVILALQFSKRFDFIACGILVTSLFHLGLMQYLSRRAIPDLSFSFHNIRTELMRRLFKKGISFQALSIGNAIQNQGSLLVVQATLGSAAVALYGTARTLVGSVIQAMGMVNQITWPEFSHLLGQGDFVRAARLHHIGSMISYSIALVGMIALVIVGQPLYSWWTGKQIDLSQHLLLLFLLPIPFTATYACSSTIHAACNRHEGLAIRYLAGTALSLASCAILARYYGVAGAALSVVVVNLVSMKYAIEYALQLTRDTWQGFIRGLVAEFVNFTIYVRNNVR